MESKTVVTGALALAVGLLGGYALSPSGPDMSDIETALGARIDAAAERGGEGVSAVAETVQALDARLESLSAKLGTLEERIGETAGAGADATTSGLDKLDLRLTETGEELRNALSELADSQKASLETALAGLSAQPAAPAAPAATETATPAADQEAAAPEGLTSGKTAILADGAIRVFVSRVDDAARSARLSINGALAHLTEGHSVALRPDGDYCRVMLDGVDRGHARVSAACGDDLPAPEGITPGSATVLGDGAAHVFLSAVSADDTTARIAVNGVDLQSVDAGGTVRVGDTRCHVNVDQIDRGHVSFSYGC
ncbi:MAG: hypothetical protein NXH97_04250 [Rhodobacteraceae bacterium]|nr:hypothetical protein [Paracoccaceae bacterium]